VIGEAVIFFTAKDSEDAKENYSLTDHRSRGWQGVEKRAVYDQTVIPAQAGIQ